MARTCWSTRFSVSLIASLCPLSSLRVSVVLRFPSGHFFLVFGVAARFKLVRQLLAAGAHDAAARQDVHHVGYDVVEQALIMRDDHKRSLRRAQPVDTFGHDLERVDVETGIGFIEHAQTWLEQRHLQDFVALLFATRKPDIDATPEHVLVDAELARDFAYAFEKFRSQYLGLPAPLALGIERGAQKCHRGNAGD